MMAHFARLNENNVVQQVIVVGNNDILDELGNESEQVGQAFIASLGFDGVWKQTSYSGSFRKNFAGLDYIYDQDRDAFIPPKPDGNCVLNEATCTWVEVVGE